MGDPGIDGLSESEPDADPRLICADGGGSNGWRDRLWKEQLQSVLCGPCGVSVTVCHYPTGCSKYNPIERRLFGPISVNWTGKPLTRFETTLAYIQGTTTTGLVVKALRREGVFEKGRKVTKKEMASLALERHIVCPNWNYTIHPRSPSPSLFNPFPELIS